MAPKNDSFIFWSVSFQAMTLCNRCGNEFDNYFNNAYWCVYCGKQFLIDENLLRKEEKIKEKKK